MENVSRKLKLRYMITTIFIMCFLPTVLKSQSQGACFIHSTLTTKYFNGTPEQKQHEYFWRSGAINSTIAVHDGTICDKHITFIMKNSGSATYQGEKCITDPGTSTMTEVQMVITVSFFPFPTLSPTSSEVTKCVGDENAKVNGFNVELTNILFTRDSIKSLLMEVADGENFTSYNQIVLPKNTSIVNFSYKDLTKAYSENWFGKGLWYRFVLVMQNNNTIYGPKISYATFFRALATPTLISVDRSACYPEQVVLQVASKIATNIDNYKFRAIKSIENINNPIRFNVINVNLSNQVFLEIDSTAKNYFNDFPDSVTFHAFDLLLDGIVDLSKHECVEKWKEFIPIPRPKLPQQDFEPEIIASVGEIDYHITRYDVANGKCNVTIPNIESCDSPLSLKYINPTGQENIISYNNLVYLDSDTRTLNGLSTGDYSMKIVDEDGCESSIGYESVSFVAPKKVSLKGLQNLDSVHCNSENESTNPYYKSNGSIGVQWTGGIPPYSIDYGASVPQTTSDTTAIVDSLPSGEVTISITDKYGVYIDDTITVHSNNKLSFNFFNEPVKCYGESTDVSIMLENSLKPNTYKIYDLSDNYLDSIKSVSNDTAMFSYLQAGEYRVEVTSGECIETDTIQLDSPNDIILLDSATKIAAYGGNTGQIFLDISEGTGEFYYSVYNEENVRVDTGQTDQFATIENLAHGYYDVYVRDENLCPKERLNIFVRQPDTALYITYNQLDVDCFGNSTGAVYPKAFGGWGHYQYGFNGAIVSSDTIISGLAATSTGDTVFVIDSANVTYKLPVSIIQPPELISSVGEIFNLKCFEDSTGAIKLNINGGAIPYEVSLDGAYWIPGDSIGKLPATENRTYYVRDSHDCRTEIKATITQPGPLSIANDTIIDAFCNKSNGGIHAVIDGGTVADGYQYEWVYIDSSQVLNNPSPSLDNIYSGQYSLRITDDNLCQSGTLFLVSDKDGPKINAWEVDSVSCFGNSDGAVHITDVSGGMPDYTFYINGMETPDDITGLPDGTHHVRVLDYKNCKMDVYIDVEEPEALTVYENITPPTCHDWQDGSVIAIFRGGNGIYSYKWGTGDSLAILDSVNSGTFSVVVTDQKGCSLQKEFEVNPPSMPKPGWEKKEALICTGNYVTVDGGGFVSWSWKDESGEEISTERAVDLRETGQFILELVDNLGCVGLDTFNLTVSDTPLDSKILLPDSAHIEETINVIDVTWPVPDSIQWFYDQPVVLLDSNSWSQHFMSEQEGLINVTLRAWYDGCYSDSSKTVQIYYEEGFEEEITKSTSNLITGYRVFPNPNSGEFTVEVALSREAEISVLLYASSMANLIDRKDCPGQDHYVIPYSLSTLKTGVYVMVIQVENERQTVKIVVN